MTPILCGQNPAVFYVKVGCTYSNHCASNGYADIEKNALAMEWSPLSEIKTKNALL
jgi:hypothetical protein